MPRSESNSTPSREGRPGAATADGLDPARFRDSIPHGIDSWYPVLRGGPAPVLFADTSELRAVQRLARGWAELPEGGRVILQGGLRQRGRVDLDELAAALERGGSAERFVVFLGPGGVATLLPTADRAAFRGGAALLGRGGRTRPGLLEGLGLLTPFGLTGRNDRKELTIWTKGGSRDGRDDLTVLPVEGSVAVIASAPDRNQKIIVRAQDRRGAARAILKIGFNQRSDDAIERETRAIEAVSKLCPGRAPELIAASERAGRSWMAQEFLEGPNGGLRITNLHANMLEELAGAGRRDLPLREIDAFQAAVRRLEGLDPGFDPDWHDAYRALASALTNATDDAKLPVHAAHGDFVPWNLAVHEGRLRAFDWEHSELRAPALHDLVHFHVQTGALASEIPGEQVFDELRSLFAGPGGRVVSALGIDGEDVLRLVSLHVLQMGVTSEVVERLRPAPLIESVRLRRVRLALCVRLAGLLAERRLPEWCLVSGRAAA
ncbi:MAG: phosphotransferase [Planctomycetota bacterium]|nr:phosphotransferase [Planctomycetota bacterium]